jgi:hypothetical protein
VGHADRLAAELTGRRVDPAGTGASAADAWSALRALGRTALAVIVAIASITLFIGDRRHAPRHPAP